MPNWTMNYMKLTGNKDSVNRAFAEIAGEDRVIDFDKIVPQPESIKNSPCLSGCEASLAISISKLAASKNVDAVEILEKLEEKPTDEFRKVREYYEHEREEMLSGNNPQFYAEFGQAYAMTFHDMMVNYLTAIKETGCVDWFDWNCKYWGTKWNSCEGNRDGNEICFSTANSSPVPIFKAIAEKYHDIRVNATSYYEDDSYKKILCYYSEKKQAVHMNVKYVESEEE